MVIRRNKKNKLSVSDKGKESRDIAPRRTYDLWTDVDRLFDQFRSNFDDLFWRPATSMTERTPLTDLADLGDKYEMRVEMPGIPKEDIDIEVTPNSVEISAEHDKSREEKDKNWLRRERSTMSFYRSFELPEEIKTENADAELRDGILTLSIPKVESKPKEKTKKIKIK